MSRRFRRRIRRGTSRFLGSGISRLEKVTRSVKRLKGLVNSELKIEVSSQIATTVNAEGTILHMNGITRGDATTNRNGRSVKIKAFKMRGSIIMNSSARASLIRVIVFINRQQADDTTPLVASLVDQANVHTPIGVFSRKRFRVIYDRFVGLSLTGEQVATVNIDIPLDLIQVYNGSAQTDIASNGIYMFMITNEASNDPVFTHTSLVEFRDN